MNSSILYYLTAVLGLGLVIFVHELGHFLVAKWNKVRVEMFALGFGKVLLAYRKGLGLRFGSTLPEYRARLEEAESRGLDPAEVPLGETEYSLRLIPLGGFVKMLGEGETSPEEEARSTDPRAYSNKSVGARMAIISAGVIMNVLFGIICYVAAFGMGGLPEMPARIGGVIAGQPAYEAGLRAGDEVVAVDGRRDIDFGALQRLTAMSGAGAVLNLEVRREGTDQTLTFKVEPQREADAEMKRMGIIPSSGLTLLNPPYFAPAGMKDDGNLAQQFRPGDQVQAVGPEGGPLQKVTTGHALDEILARLADQPVTLQLLRQPEGSGKAQEVLVTLPPVPMVDLGLRLEIGPIVSIRPDSPAARAGLRVGDRIASYEGRTDLDPIRLPDELARDAGQPRTLQVYRSEGGKPEELVTLTITPTPELSWVEPTAPAEPMDAPSIGAAYTILPRIAEVRPDSPAARAGLRSGQTIASITLTTPPIGDEAGEPLELTLDGKQAAWPFVFERMQELPRHAVELVIAGQSKPVRITPEPVSGWYSPRRGLQFGLDHQPLPPMPPLAALRRGLEETYDTIGNIYRMFRSLALGMISPKALGGPIEIFQMASQTARVGSVSFLQFLGLLSLNLAVINFLPIPPLDGGQMVYLLAEKFRGRPLPEKALNASMFVGLFFVLGLLVFVVFQDITKLFN